MPSAPQPRGRSTGRPFPAGRGDAILRKSDGIGPVVMQNLPTGPTVRDRGRFCIHQHATDATVRGRGRDCAGPASIELGAKDRAAQPPAARGITAGSGGCRRTRATGTRPRARRRRSARSSSRPATASSIIRCEASGSCQPVIRPSTAAHAASGVIDEAGPARSARSCTVGRAPPSRARARRWCRPRSRARRGRGWRRSSPRCARGPRTTRGTAARGSRARTRRRAA